MADGTMSVALEAQGAAADTARESDHKQAPWAEFTVDVWITDLNSVEFGIYKHSRNRAKSRQFTSDMDIFAEIIENGERTGLLGYREDLWRNNTGMDKRLVFKLFNETLNWRATMDLMLGRSLQLTLGARGFPVTAFSINTVDHDSMVYLERSANKWPLLPEDFSFFLLDDGRPRFYRLTRRLIDLGGDYTLYSHRNEAVGRLDGKVFSIGGKWYGHVHPAHASPHLLTVLKLFCGMLIFNADARRHMRWLARDVVRGKLEPELDRQESDLYANPRRTR